MIQRFLNKLKTLFESPNAIRFYISLVLVIGLSVFLIISYHKIKSVVAERDDNRDEIVRLEMIIEAQERTVAKERELRRLLMIEDSTSTAQLLELKKADSLLQVRTIKGLMKHYSKLREKELDSLLLLEYEKALVNP